MIRALIYTHRASLCACVLVFLGSVIEGNVDTDCEGVKQELNNPLYQRFEAKCIRVYKACIEEQETIFKNNHTDLTAACRLPLSIDTR